MSMDMLVTKPCLSVRQMERHSLQRIGLSPKYFARIVRFSIAYKFKESNPKASWSEIAHQFGYEDICIQDFHHFTVVTPSEKRSKIRYDSVLKFHKFSF